MWWAKSLISSLSMSAQNVSSYGIKYENLMNVFHLLGKTDCDLDLDKIEINLDMEKSIKCLFAEIE